MRSVPRILALTLLVSLGLWWFEPAALPPSSAHAASGEASATLLGRFVINNIFGWEGIPGTRLKGGIYVTLYHPRSGKSRELVTDGRGYVTLRKAAAGTYVLKEITYLAESLLGSSRLTAPLTVLTCDVAPSSVTYCGTVVYTFRRLPEGRVTYTGRVQPEKPGVQGLDILDESRAARATVASGASGPFRTSLWVGQKGLPTWEAALHFHQGYEYSQSRRYDEAIPEFKAGLQKDPQHAWAHYMLAKAFQWQGRDKEVLAAYGEVFRLRPDYSWAHHSLGIYHLLRARYGLARQEFQRAAAIDPAFVKTSSYHLEQLEKMARVEGTPLEDYRARTPEETSLLAEVQAALEAVRKADWKAVFSYFADDARIDAHCGACDPSKFFPVEDLRDYLTQPLAKNYGIVHLQVRLLSVKVTGSEADVRFFLSYELVKTNKPKGWWYADVSSLKARRVGGRWKLTEHKYIEHLHESA